MGILGSSDDREEQGAAAKAAPATPAAATTLPCVSSACTVTVNPTSVKLCDTTTKKQVTATATPSGGTFAWAVADPAIATISGSGRKIALQGAQAGKTKVTVTYTVAGCSCSSEVEVRVCTCTPKPGDGRYYTSAGKSIANVIGVSASIKTRYGKVCCEDEGCSTKAAYHCAYANISNTTGRLIWAQSGYGRERNAGASATPTTLTKYRYAEMQGNSYKIHFDIANAPAEGVVHQYRCELDGDNGKWRFSFDGSEWQIYADTRWRGNTGTSIQYTGEIFNIEDDMPGTEDDKCEFTECQYLTVDNTVTEESAPEATLEAFGFDASAVTPDQQATLDAIADRVAESWRSGPKVVKIRLVGHTDSVGSAGYNVGLGQRRAAAARTELVRRLDDREAGLSSKVRIVTESKGESEPVDTSGTEEGNARNRRVEIFLSTQPLPTYEDAGLVAVDVQSDDDAEWGAEWVSDTAFNIWDKKPLP